MLALALFKIVNYDGFIVQVTVITIVNYDCNTFIVQATVVGSYQQRDLNVVFYLFVVKIRFG
jgi:hypothetical protein